MSKSKNILYLGLDPSRYVTAKQVVHCPLIEILPRKVRVKKLFLKATRLIFTSRSAVKVFFALLANEGIEEVNKECIAVGKATAALLKERGIVAKVPEVATAEGVVELLKTVPLEEGFTLFPHSALSRKVISHYLQRRGVAYAAFPLYDTVFLPPNPWPQLDEIEEIVFTSPSTVEAFCHFFKTLPKNKILTPVGPVTKEKLLSKKALLP